MPNATDLQTNRQYIKLITQHKHAVSGNIL